MTAASSRREGDGAPDWRRWRQLLWGIVCVVAIANLQYGWTLFIKPIDEKYHWGTAAIQIAFWIFVATETLVAALGIGRLIDRFGPACSCASGPLIAVAWIVNSCADSLLLFYLTAISAGLGAGLIFAATFGNAVKWFPDRRGVATGLTAAGYNGVAALPVESVIQSSGYEAAFLWFGLGQGILVFVVALLLRAPRPDDVRREQVTQVRNDYPLREVVKSPPFWVMYAMFVMVGTGGLVVGAQLGPVVTDLGIDKAPASILGLTLPTLSFTLLVTGVTSAISRPLFGILYDKIGRAWTMFTAFFLQAIALALIAFASTPKLFVISAGLVFFAWGQIFALFPASCADIYGSKFAAQNYGLLYTAKGVAALMIPLTNELTAAMGGWTVAFCVVSALSFLAAVLVHALEFLRIRVMRK